jgi:hypothetical protein
MAAVGLIGDRTERDGEAARRAGSAALIRASRPIDCWRTDLGGAVFASLVR